MPNHKNTPLPSLVFFGANLCRPSYKTKQKTDYLRYPRPAMAATAEVKPVHIHSDRQFGELLAMSPSVIVDCYTTWCRPCKDIAPFFQSLASEHPHVQFVKCDMEAESNESLADKLQVKSFPTFLFFYRGVRTDVVVGKNPKALKALAVKAENLALEAGAEENKATARRAPSKEAATITTPARTTESNVCLTLYRDDRETTYEVISPYDNNKSLGQVRRMRTQEGSSWPELHDTLCKFIQHWFGADEICPVAMFVSDRCTDQDRDNTMRNWTKSLDHMRSQGFQFRV